MAKEDIDALVADYQAGRSVRQLVRTYAINRTTVLDHLERRGISRRANGRKLTDQDVVHASYQYRNGAPLVDVADNFGVDPSTIRRELVRASIKLRDPGRRSRIN